MHQIATDGIFSIVGQDAIIALNALIDLSSEQLLVPESTSDIHHYLKNKKPSNYTSASLHKSPMGFHIVDFELAGHDVRLFIDSGAPQVVLDKTQLKRLGLDTVPHETATMVLDDGAEVAMRLLGDSDLTIEGATIEGDLMVGD